MGGASLSAQELGSLSAAARRIARARGADESTADDIAQETITRLLAVSDRLEPSARLPFAITTAGNLLVSLHRAADRARRHQHRLVDYGVANDPQLAAVAVEEAAAVRAALDALEPGERHLLVQHVEGESTVDLAALDGSNPAAIAARLARTRAKLRLDYLLALRRVELPTVSCRRVLLAVSAADQRRQAALGAAAHLAQCPTCTELIPPLVRRSSFLAGLVAAPLIAMGRFGGHLQRGARNHVVQASAAATVVVVAAGLYVADSSETKASTHSIRPSSVQASPANTPTISAAPPVTDGTARTASGAVLLPVPDARRLRSLVDQRIEVRDVPVQSVVSHPGFWIGSAGSQRLYVHLDRADLIRQRIRTGAHVSFIGVLQFNATGFAAADGVTQSESARLLTAQGVHVEVDATAISQS